MPLEIFAGGRKVAAELEDLSRTGMFVRVDDPPPEGTLVHVAFSDGAQRFVTSGRVMHSLDETDARSLGRRVGIGIELCLPTRPNDELFSIAVERLISGVAHTHPPRAADRRIIVATSHVRLIERLSAAFGAAGFSVGTAGNGLEAIAACLRAKPDVLVVERTLPIIDGIEVVERIAATPKLAGLPMIVMSDDPRDGTAAFELGAMDFVTKPFSTDELVLRVRRLVRGPQHVVFSGDLAEIPLPALLTMFELERKSGQLVLHRLANGAHTNAWIDLEDGRIVNARSTEIHADPRSVVMGLLDWTAGQFELTTSRDEELPPCELALQITHLLLEHARQSDEARRLMAM